MPASPFRTDEFPPPNFSGERIGQAVRAVRPEWGRAMEVLEVGDGKFATSEIDGLPTWKAEGAYLYYRAPELREPMRVRVHLLYRDVGFGTIQLRYDSTSEEVFAGQRPGVWRPAGEVRCRNSGKWMLVAFDLPDAKFSKRCNGGDLRLQCQGTLTVGGVFYDETEN